VISFESVSKTFHHHTGPKLLRAHVQDFFFRREGSAKPFEAVKNVSFRITARESVAIVGRNGAGKSTLLSLVAGLAKPTSGKVNVDGRVAALMELGSGFHPDLTGRENVRLNAALLGFNRAQTDAAFDAMVEFSGIGEFINEPVRTYSSGMIVRLAFSVAVNVNPDILIIDEVLAVGDQAFQAKCLGRIHQFREEGKTLFFVSHNPVVVRQICTRVLWLDRGELVLDGSPEEVLDAYTGLSASGSRSS
jgi:ABC-type polysaccharide/polyol phosphate transport system ATPase subunit